MHHRSETSPPIVLGLAQLFRKRALLLATIVLGAAFVVLGSRWPDGKAAFETIKLVGVILIMTCILGRTWSSLYIAGRKDVSLVTVGPYSICRNPLYVFSILGAVGVGAQFGTVTGALVVGLLAWVVFELVAQQEERSLRAAYGALYDEYCARVPRFLPRWSQWRGVATVEVDPSRVGRTFVDACFFLIAIPAAEMLQRLQEAGHISVLFRLP